MSCRSRQCAAPSADFRRSPRQPARALLPRRRSRFERCAIPNLRRWRGSRSCGHYSQSVRHQPQCCVQRAARDWNTTRYFRGRVARAAGYFARRLRRPADGRLHRSAIGHNRATHRARRHAYLRNADRVDRWCAWCTTDRSLAGPADPARIQRASARRRRHNNETNRARPRDRL